MKEIKICNHPGGCERVVEKKGLCGLHYQRLRLKGELGEVDTIREYDNSKICKIEGCQLATWSKGYCNLHYKRFKKYGEPGSYIRKRNDLPVKCSDNEKICRACNEIKLLSEFSKASKGHKGHMSKCKNCMKYINIKKCYNLSREEYDSMMKNVVCEICNRSREKMCIDHCHTSGKTRGVLCTYCNSAIGLFEDDLKFLENAIKYLEKHEYLKQDKI